MRTREKDLVEQLTASTAPPPYVRSSPALTGWQALRADLNRQVAEMTAKAVVLGAIGIKKGVVAGLRHPAELAPLGAAAALPAVVAATDYTSLGWITAVVVIALAGYVLVENALSGAERRRARRATRRLFNMLAATASLVYMVSALATAPFAPFALRVYAYSLLALALGWWVRGGRWRLRRREPEPAAAPPELDEKARHNAEFTAWWAAEVSGEGGLLIDSRLIDLDCTADTQRAVIVLGRREHTLSSALAIRVRVARLLGLAQDNVQITPLPDMREDRAQIAIYKADPQLAPRIFEGPEIDFETGCVRVGTYLDGSPATVQFWVPGSGTLSELVCGGSGVGKSRTVDLLLSAERHCLDPETGRHLIVSWVGDPQMGQSLPEWQDRIEHAEDGTETLVKRVDRFASGTPAVLEMLEDFYAELLARNAAMAKIEWTDERGRVHIGKDHYEPNPDMPILSLTIEEAHNVMKIPRAVFLIEQSIKLIRKCGQRMRLITQIPSITEFGGSLVIRPMLADMNVIALRTSTPITENSFNLPGDPKNLPRKFPDGSRTEGLCYLIGGEHRPSRARIDYVDDPYYWADSGTTAVLNRLAPPRPAKVATAGSAASAPAAPAHADAPEAGPTAGEDTAAEGVFEGKPRDRIAKVLQAALPALLTTGVIMERTGLGASTVSTTAARMAADGDAVDGGYSLWGAPGADIGYWKS